MLCWNHAYEDVVFDPCISGCCDWCMAMKMLCLIHVYQDVVTDVWLSRCCVWSMYIRMLWLMYAYQYVVFDPSVSGCCYWSMCINMLCWIQAYTDVVLINAYLDIYSLTYTCNHSFAWHPSRIGVGWPLVIRFKASTMKMQALFNRICFTSTVQSTMQLSQSLATVFI